MDSELSYVLVLFVCFLFSAIFSGAETSLTSIPEATFRKIVDEKKGFIKHYQLWLAKPNRVLTAIIIGNNLVNTLAAVVATLLAQKIFHEFVISISTTLTTLALLIFGEITPKTFARHNAQKVVSGLLILIYPIYFLLFPVVFLLTHLATFLVKLFGGRTSREGPVATGEDIAYLIRLSHEEGVFKKEHGHMLERVISFTELSAREIMIPRPELCALDINCSYPQVLEAVAQHGYTRWPVYRDDIDQIEGILYVKDLINFAVAQKTNFSLVHHLRRAIFVPEAMKLDSILKEFQKQKLHMAIVVDEYGGTAGVITLEDILEEIVGEIRDEYDKEEEENSLTKVGEDHFICEARISISDLKKQSGIELPNDESFDTLGGFLVSELGRIPKRGESVHFGVWVFRATEVDEKRIVRIEITKDAENLLAS